MKKHWFKGTAVVAFALGALLGVGLLGHAFAQYPPITGSMVLGAGDSTPTVGEDVEVTATVLDENGQPVVGADCTFSIAQQPGNDASVDAGPFTTDAQGNVSTTLHTGSTAGQIVVEATCGQLTAQVLVTAQAPQAAGTTPAAPPASLPSTGAQVSEDGDSMWAFWALIGAGALVGLSGVALAWRRMKP